MSKPNIYAVRAAEVDGSLCLSTTPINMSLLPHTQSLPYTSLPHNPIYSVSELYPLPPILISRPTIDL